MGRRLLTTVLAGLVLACAVGTASTMAQTLVPAPTDPPPPATEPQPTRPPETSAPPESSATVPVAAPVAPSLPEADRPRREQEQVPAATGLPTQAPLLPAAPFRTQRPTRTPRAVTPTTTPFSAAALRITLAADPPVVRRGEPVTARVQLLNQSPLAAAQILVEVALPPGLQLEAVSPLTGSAEPVANVINWTVPALDAGASTRLVLRALVLRVDQGSALCATLLSSGSPVENCVALSAESGIGGADLPAESEFVPTGAPSGSSGSPLEWVLLLLGLLLLGLWGGTASPALRAKFRARSGH